MRQKLRWLTLKYQFSRDYRNGTSVASTEARHCNRLATTVF